MRRCTVRPPEWSAAQQKASQTVAGQCSYGAVSHQQVDPQQQGIDVVHARDVVSFGGGVDIDVASNDDAGQHKDESVCQVLQLFPASLICAQVLGFVLPD